MKVLAPASGRNASSWGTAMTHWLLLGTSSSGQSSRPHPSTVSCKPALPPSAETLLVHQVSMASERSSSAAFAFFSGLLPSPLIMHLTISTSPVIETSASATGMASGPKIASFTSCGKITVARTRFSCTKETASVWRSSAASLAATDKALLRACPADPGAADAAPCAWCSRHGLSVTGVHGIGAGTSSYCKSSRVVLATSCSHRSSCSRSIMRFSSVPMVSAKHLTVTTASHSALW
mmetsp:Transcript_10217/g.26466  ORF Transcript_10217/g.26466 Transcript_10217/m.26466 type:complete len:236 (+) Transcript_10217:683-1390(+)